MSTAPCSTCDQVVGLLADQTQLLNQLTRVNRQASAIRNRLSSPSAVDRSCLAEIESRLRHLEKCLDQINAELSFLRAYHLHLQPQYTRQSEILSFS